MNVFQFPNIWQSSFSVAYFSSFRSEIGDSNANEIRRIRIAFPSFYDYRGLADEGAADGAKEDLQANFKLIREKFLGLSTLELILYGSSPEESSDATAELLGLMNHYLGTIVSPRGIVVRISKDENPDSQLIKAMCDYGWKVEFGEKEEKPEWKEPFYDIILPPRFVYIFQGRLMTIYIIYRKYSTGILKK